MLELLQINYLVEIRNRAIAFVCLIFFVLLVSTASVLNADQHTIKAHGFNFFGELKYPNDFQHLDYVNPNAPKGGEISIWGFGTFDSMNPYSRKGRAASLSSAPFESLLVETGDEIGSSYGLLAESIEYPGDQKWVIFQLRKEAKFSDGHLLTIILGELPGTIRAKLRGRSNRSVSPVIKDKSGLGTPFIPAIANCSRCRSCVCLSVGRS